MREGSTMSLHQFPGSSLVLPRVGGTRERASRRNVRKFRLSGTATKIIRIKEQADRLMAKIYIVIKILCVSDD